MNRKKVLLVHDYTALHGGGVVHLNLDLAQFLNRAGFESTVAIPPCCFSCSQQKPQYLSFIGERDKKLKFRRSVKIANSLVVSISWKILDLAKWSINASRQFNKPYAVWLHTRLPDGYEKTESGREMSEILKDGLCRAFICVSKSVEEDVVSKFGPSNKIKTIYPGVYLAQRYERQVFTEFQADSNTILVSGRFSHDKGIDIFLRALVDVQKKVKSVRAQIIGDGAESQSLQRLSKELGLGKTVSFLPACSRSELFKRMNLCRIYCVPSRNESFCLSLVEALICGANVVGPDTGGPKEILQKGEHGYLFRVGDEKDLARALLTALKKTTGDGLSKKLSMLKRFDMNKQFQKLIFEAIS